MKLVQRVIDEFQKDGATCIRNCLTDQQLEDCYTAFKWNIENPSPANFTALNGTVLETHIDNCNYHAKDRLDALVKTLPFGEIFKQLWGSKHVWYFAEEVFAKEGGNSGRGLWHQDTSNLPWAGKHWGNAWITFQTIPKKNSLEIIRGSHKGPQYDGASFLNPEDPTDPLHGDGTWPRLPHIDKDLAEDPNSWDVLSWVIEPKDVVFLHPHALHGGASVDKKTPTRHTLVLRFFGDDATFRPLPMAKPRYARNGPYFIEHMSKLNEGDLFRASVFQQLI